VAARHEMTPPMSRETLARAIGVSLRTMQRWENEETVRGISVADLTLIAKVLGRPLSYFLTEVAA
jgi:transcriptional regulator with XRE-family HTH domain